MQRRVTSADASWERPFKCWMRRSDGWLDQWGWPTCGGVGFVGALMCRSNILVLGMKRLLENHDGAIKISNIGEE
jgi:hypothetical protein